MAHTTHFTSADHSWFLLGGTGSGHIGDGKVHPIPAAPGGWNVSYVTYVKRGDPACGSTRLCPFTLVVESFFAGGVWHSSHKSLAPVAAAPAVATFQLAGNLAGWAGRSISAWHSTSTHQFVHEADVPVAADGSFSISINASEIWTYTTVASAHPGAEALLASLAESTGAVSLTPAAVARLGDDGPPDSPFPLPFADNFESYRNDTLPLFSSDMFGAFSVYALPAGAPRTSPLATDLAAAVPCAADDARLRWPDRCVNASAAPSRVLRQWTRQPPIGWNSASSNMATLYGNYTLSNIRVSVDALIETVAAGFQPSQTPYLLFGLHGGNGVVGGNAPKEFYDTGPAFDFVWLDVTGSWGCGISGLTSGVCGSSHTVPGGVFDYDTWHAVSFEAAVRPDGAVAFAASFDGQALFNATVPKVQVRNEGRGGYVGLVTGCHRAQFDNLAIVSL